MTAIEERTPDELRAQLEELAQHYFKMTADEFIKEARLRRLPDNAAVHYMLALTRMLAKQ